MTTATRYISVTDTAKLVRVQLAKHFPGVKFSVRSQSYSGGASVSVYWTDGPRTKDVDRIVGGFESRSFDGMNDLATSQDSWLTPSGHASLAYRADSYGGSIPGYVSDAPHPNAEIVRFGANYVQTQRSISNFDTKLAAAITMIQSRCTTEGLGINERFGNQWVSDLASNMVYDQADNETLDTAFKHIVMREDQ
jgi:hypothetical protein